MTRQQQTEIRRYAEKLGLEVVRFEKRSKHDAAILSNGKRSRFITLSATPSDFRTGYEHKIKRPKGWRGQRLTHWLRPEQAFSVFKATEKINAPEPTRIAFRVLLRLLCYTGMRLGDALDLQCRNVDLKASTALLPTTKNKNPRLVYLPKIIIEELRRLPDGLNRDGRVFRFHDGGRLRDLLKETLAIAGITLPRRVAFHVFCHTWATWMRQHCGLDTFDLLKTDRWADAESADRYAHVVVSEQAKKADMLPVEPRRQKAR